MSKLANPSKVKELIRRYNFKIKKGLGQNFLISEAVVEKILEGADLTPEDIVVEIGPGLGTMTLGLAERTRGVLAVELDTALLPILNENLKDFPNVKIVNGDVLKLNLDEEVTKHFSFEAALKYKVVANLPYYITTPIVMHLLEHKKGIESMVFMVQREVAERMVANPGGKDYGALSVAVQYYTLPSLITHVPPSAFFPAPEVASTVVKLKVREQPPVQVENEKLFFQVVKGAFAQRRKTLLNALNNRFSHLSKEELAQIFHFCDIDPSRRGETLSIEEFAKLANALDKNKRA